MATMEEATNSQPLNQKNSLEIGSSGARPQTPPPLEIDFRGLALVFLAPALGGFIYGYDIGATSFVLAVLRNSRDADVWWYNFPGIQQGLVISSLALGALLGSHVVLIFLSDSIGRRKEIRVAASLYIAGALLNIMSGSVLAYSPVNDSGFGIGLIILLCGRLLTGVGVGFIMHGAPTYMAEMSPSRVRGTLVSAKETVIVFGIVVGMLNGDLLSDYQDNWVGLYYISIVSAIPMLLLTFRIPRSKRWLLMKGYREEAKESMEFVYKGDVGEEFERMAETITNLCCQPISGSISDDSTSTNSVDIDTNSTGNDAGKVNQVQRDAQNMFSSRYRHIMLLGVGLLVLQQFSGQPAVLAYSRVLFEAAGWNSHSSVVTVLIMGVASSLTVAFVDKLGRKILLMTGSFLMTCSVSVLAIAFWNWDEDYGLSDTKKVLVLGGMFVFIASYQIGFGPITWTVLSEVYPIEIRGKAMAFSVEVNFLCKFLSQLFFPIIQDFFGWGSTFLIFTGTCLAGLVFVYLTVPETKGMSLEEIQQHIAKPTNDTPPSEIMDHPLESSLLDKESSYVPPRDLNPIS